MLGALISAGTSLLGGLLGKSSADKDRKAAEANAARQEALQREFAQSGIQWKVEDAKKAGIHPLYALGANTHSYSPITVGSSADMSMPNAVASMGQDIGRAVDATRSSSQKITAFQQTAQQLTLQKMGLENELLASQIARSRSMSNPPMPSSGDRYVLDGQSNSGLVELTPMERIKSAHGRPWQEPAAVSDIGYTQSRTGFPVVYSRDAKDRLEEDTGGMLAWNLRNRVLPTMTFNMSPPYPAPKGKAWFFHPLKQEYQLVSKYYPFS